MEFNSILAPQVLKISSPTSGGHDMNSSLTLGFSCYADKYQAKQKIAIENQQNFVNSSNVPFYNQASKKKANDCKRFCRFCARTKSVLWRKGPDGPQTLCNACGLRHARVLKKGLAVYPNFHANLNLP